MEIRKGVSRNEATLLFLFLAYGPLGTLTQGFSGDGEDCLPPNIYNDCLYQQGLDLSDSNSILCRMDFKELYNCLVYRSDFCSDYLYDDNGHYDDFLAFLRSCVNQGLNVRVGCNPQICQNGGSCVTLSPEFSTCMCFNGFPGPPCLTNQGCPNLQCLNGGSCLRSAVPAICSCPQGFTGAYCEVPPLPILSQNCPDRPCQNGGYCQITGLCSCPPNYSGVYCEVPLGSVQTQNCPNRPCKNGGYCQITGLCSCPPSYSGVYCEVPLRSVPTQNCPTRPCQNGGFCPQSTGPCSCPPNYSGVYCEVQLRTVLTPSCPEWPCQNGGSCRASSRGISCFCPPGYAGAYCEVTPQESQPVLSQTAIIGIAAGGGAFLLILIIIISCVVIKCKNDSKSKDHRNKRRSPAQLPLEALRNAHNTQPTEGRSQRYSDPPTGGNKHRGTQGRPHSTGKVPSGPSHKGTRAQKARSHMGPPSTKGHRDYNKNVGRSPEKGIRASGGVKGADLPTAADIEWEENYCIPMDPEEKYGMSGKKLPVEGYLNAALNLKEAEGTYEELQPEYADLEPVYDQMYAKR